MRVYEVEDRMKESISFSRFAGISLDNLDPVHNMISSFRGETRYEIETDWNEIASLEDVLATADLPDNILDITNNGYKFK